MRALIQRVLEAKVVVDGQTTGEIEKGLLVFLGLGKDDTLEKGQKLIDKILKYRILISFFSKLLASMCSKFSLPFIHPEPFYTRNVIFFPRGLVCRLPISPYIPSNPYGT